MAYRIEYDAGIQKYEIKEQRTPKLPAMICGAFVIFIILSVLFWPEGTQVLRDLLIPGDDAQTLQALQLLTEQLREGMPVAEAFTGFCREILHGA